MVCDFVNVLTFMLIIDIILSKKVKKMKGSDDMNDSKNIMILAKQNNGIITTAMVVAAGFSRGNLKYLTDTGRLERITRGVYSLPEAWEDEFVSLQNRYKRGVFSLETALFLNNLTDRTPNKFNMTFPCSYNLTSPKNAGILCNSSYGQLYSLGKTEINTPGGNIVKVYNAERTLCDILKPRNHTDIQIITDAFKQYTLRKDRNIPMLSDYARLLKVEGKVRSYLEVLL